MLAPWCYPGCTSWKRNWHVPPSALSNPGRMLCQQEVEFCCLSCPAHFRWDRVFAAQPTLLH